MPPKRYTVSFFVIHEAEECRGLGDAGSKAVPLASVTKELGVYATAVPSRHSQKPAQAKAREAF